MIVLCGASNRACDFDTIFMRVFDIVFKDERRIVVNLDTNFIQAELIPQNLRLNIYVCVDAWTSAIIYGVAVNNWLTLSSLNVDACSVTWYYLIAIYDNFIVPSGLKHQTTTLELLELALFYKNISVDSKKTCCSCLICLVTLQFTVSHFQAGAIQDSDAGHFLLSLDSVEWQYAVL